MNPTENLWHCLKTTGNKQHLTNLKNLEQICQEEWEHHSQTGTYSNRLEAVFTAIVIVIQ